MNMRFLTLSLTAAAAITGGALTALAADISGAGATFPYPIYAKWADAYKKETGVGLNYQSIGSGGGIKQIQNKTVTFGASDAPLKGADLEKFGLVQFPMVMGGIVPVVNLEGIKPGELVIDGPTLAKIFLGEIKTWDDPAIKKLNPNAKLPSQAIAVVHRSDGSGTTYNFAYYLSDVSADWKSKVGVNTSVQWPVGIGAKGNEGVANNVKPRPRARIGYVEYAYALQNKLTHMKMINKAGKTVAPTSEAFQAAAANADWKSQPGYGVILANQPGEKSWPMTAATWILMYKQPQDAAASAQALKFFAWAYKKGDKMADELHYVPMPAQRRGRQSRRPGPPKSRTPAQARLCDEGAGTAPARAAPGAGQLAPPGLSCYVEPTMRAGRLQQGLDRDETCADIALHGAWTRRRHRSSRRGPAETAPQRYCVSHADAHRRPTGAGASWRRDRCADCPARMPALQKFGFGFLTDRGLEPGHRNLRRLAPIYGTVVTSIIAMLIAVPVGIMIALFLTELCPPRLAPRHRHHHRAAGRHPQHHLRHLGPVRFCAVSAAARAAAADRRVRQHPGPVDPFRRSALRHRHAHRRPHPGDHGAALHHLDLARRVRCRAAGPEGGRLRCRLHHLGGVPQCRAALHPRRRDRRRHAGARPRARRDHGGHLRDRQRAPHLGLDPGARHDHLGHHRQRVHRGRRRHLHLCR